MTDVPGMVMSARHPKRVIPGATEQAAVRTERRATMRIARSNGRGARMSPHAAHEENTSETERPRSAGATVLGNPVTGTALHEDSTHVTCPY